MINWKTLFAALFCVALVMPTVAEEEKEVGSGPNPFSDCGIGAALFPKTPVGAVISNIIWDVGSTAVTSATASPETCNGKQAKTAQFILDNYDLLVEETARGRGEYLAAMLNIMQCGTSTQEAVISEIRENMTPSVSDPSYPEKDKVSKAAELYNSVILAAQSCTA